MDNKKPDEKISQPATETAQQEKKTTGEAQAKPAETAQQENKTTGEAQAKPAETTPATEMKTITITEAEYLELKQKSEKANENRDRLLRLQADFENSRKRWERDKQEYIRFAQEEILAHLLNIVDDFERSLKVAPARIEDLSIFIKGIEMMFFHLQDLIKKNGVVPMNAKGKLFDPNLHEALMMIENEDLPENTVVEELQKGYFLHNRVLRVARVQLSKKKETPPPAN